MGKFLKTIVLALGLVSSLNAFADAKSDLQDLLKILMRYVLILYRK